MKLKDVEIVIMSDEEYGEHLNQLFERVKRGEPHKIIARTAEDIGKILTRERLRLLSIIREKRLESISELARILKRKESNVHNDLTFLEGIGLLSLRKGKITSRKCLLLTMMRCILRYRYLFSSLPSDLENDQVRHYTDLLIYSNR
ncbi:MAG: hypothetical protein O8C66_04365 [Candidatus Methanoperedens sp.]|nr:hypothetical protein [Candidatus Methanoperedens sp.]MCZ7369722.1 hypothetical protein [Candidatus Methanoperedens sp.]